MQRWSLAHAAVLLCVSLLAIKVNAGSVELIHEPKVIEMGYVRVNAFDLQYTIFTSINFTLALGLTTDQLGRFTKICISQSKGDIRNYRDSLKTPRKLLKIRELTAFHQVKRLQGTPLILGVGPSGAGYRICCGTTTGAIGYLSYQDIVIRKDLEAMMRHQVKIANLTLNVTHFDYHRAEDKSIG